MDAWESLFGDRVVTVAEVLEESFDSAETEKRRQLKDALHEFAADLRGGGGINNKRLGRWLLAVRGRMLGERAFEEAGAASGVKRWRLRGAAKEASWLEG